MVSLQLTRMLSAEHSAARQQGSKTAGLHGSAAARQHNIDSRYKIAAINQNDCPSGWSNLIDAEACRVAALALGKIAHPNDAVFINRDNQHRPNGCFLWFSGSVHFNTLTPTQHRLGRPVGQPYARFRCRWHWRGCAPSRQKDVVRPYATRLKRSTTLRTCSG